jgi:hypothetical protein
VDVEALTAGRLRFSTAIGCKRTGVGMRAGERHQHVRSGSAQLMTDLLLQA